MLVAIAVGGRSGTILTSTGIVLVLVTTLDLEGSWRIAMFATAPASFLGRSVGMAWWFRRGGAVPATATVVGCYVAAALALGGTASVWWIESPPAAVAAVGALQLALGAGLSVGWVLRPAVMRLSIDPDRDFPAIERAVFPTGAVLTLGLAALAQVDGRWALLAAGAVVAGLGAVYPSWSQRPEREEVVARPSSVRDFRYRPGFIPTVAMGIASFALLSTAYTVALDWLEALTLGPLGELGPLRLSALLAAVSVVTAVCLLV